MRVKDFEERKKYFLNRLKEAIEKGEADKPILHLLDLINSFPCYVTTSSCAGRIVLMKIPESGKKWEAEFIFKKHEEVTFEEVWEALKEGVKKYKEHIWFRAEPVIIHVDCKDLESAIKIVRIARECGWKRSGIFEIKSYRVMVELHSTERLDVPVAVNGEIKVTEDFMRFLVYEANKKLRKTREKMQRFYEKLKELRENWGRPDSNRGHRDPNPAAYR